MLENLIDELRPWCLACAGEGKSRRAEGVSIAIL